MNLDLFTGIRIIKEKEYPFDVIDPETNKIIVTIHMTQDEKGLHVSPEIYDAVKSKFKKRDEND